MKQQPTRRVVFLTLDDPSPFVIDDDLAVPAMAKEGWHVDSVSWRADVDWNDWDAVLIRTPWDYQDDADAFLEVLGTIDASSARLENPIETVRWNLRKTYLRELERQGVLIVPSLWGIDEPPTVESLRAAFEAVEFQREFQDEFEVGGRSIVVKPVVSANADDTFPVTDAMSDGELGSIARTFTRADGAGSSKTVRPYMIQPFLRSVVEEGEVSLFYFGGELSHAILKTPRRATSACRRSTAGGSPRSAMTTRASTSPRAGASTSVAAK